MIPEIGHYALILALCVAVVQGTLPIYGAAVMNASLMAVAKPAACLVVLRRRAQKLVDVSVTDKKCRPVEQLLSQGERRS
jgi:hypothetical protein